MISIKRVALNMILLGSLFMAGCGGVWIPERFASLNEVYSTQNYLQSIDSIPPESIQKRVFDAPFEDVYQAVNVSASQAQLDVRTENKADGLILAMQTLTIDPPSDLMNCPANDFSNKKQLQWKYYYLIFVREKGSRSTEVVVMVKAQGRCLQGGCFGKDPCPDYASVHWATGYDNAEGQLSQLMVFIRNNLIQAGLI